MSERIVRWVITSIVVAAHLAAYIQFQYKIGMMPLPPEWRDQFGFLLIISLLLVAMISFCRKPLFIWLFLFFQGGVLLVIGLPLADYLGVEITLLTAFILELFFFTDLWYGLATAIGITAISIISQHYPITAWGQKLAVASVHDQLSFAIYTGFIIVLAGWLRFQTDHQVRIIDQNRHLHEATLQLSQINMQLQEYAAMAEQESIITERKRLAREIHDTLAYTLTNLVMMMEAAMDMAIGQNAALLEHLHRSRDQAKEGLTEVRVSLQELRSVQSSETAGLPAIKQMIDTFVKATQMEVSLNFGNVPNRFGGEADWAAYRVVQEGITNALRHGRATRVWVSFSRVGAGITIRIWDNGIGAAGFKEGYGLVGMRERVERLGGRLSIQNKAGEGFLLSVWFPLKEGVQ